MERSDWKREMERAKCLKRLWPSPECDFCHE